MTRRPLSVTIVGWLFIAAGVTGLAYHAGDFRTMRPAEYALVCFVRSLAVVGGVLTPGPDILSQLMMAGPLFGLFNLSIVLVWLIERARRKKLEALAQETGADLIPSD